MRGAAAAGERAAHPRRAAAEHRRRAAMRSRAEQRRYAPLWSSDSRAARGGGVGEGRRVGQEGRRRRASASAWVAAGAREGARVREGGEGLGVLIQRL